jgi:hypothetical protein
VKAPSPLALTQGLSFRSAKALCDADEKYGGMGIITGDWYGVIRLHGHGRNGQISEEARRILSSAESYAELSGNDISIFYRRVKSGGRRFNATPRSDVTLLEGGDFVPVTGKHISQTPRSLNESQVALESVIRASQGVTLDGSGNHEDQVDNSGNKDHDIEDDSETFEIPDWEEEEAEKDQYCENEVNELPESTPEVHEDVKVYQAIRRDAVAWSYWSDATFTGSRRRAKTFALLKKLAFYCSHCRAQMDRLFRRSKLMTPEWDRVVDSPLKTYGARMIAEACEATDGNWVPRPRRTGNPSGRLKTPRTRAVEAALAANPSAEVTEIAKQMRETRQYVWNIKNGYRPRKG